MLPTLDTWLACFERRAASPPAIPAAADQPLSGAERLRIARSIATFQRGEQSEGHTLLALARRHAAQHHCPNLIRITECFIREEQRHAAMLAEFMAAHDILLRTRDASDVVFRQFRRLMGFELAITVLITAELIGIQYYRALLRSSGSKRLQGICSLFMQDEALHVAYESELLLALRARRGRVPSHLVTRLHGAFHIVTALVVWFGHRRVLQAAGHTAWGFLSTCARHYALYLEPPPASAPHSRDSVCSGGAVPTPLPWSSRSRGQGAGPGEVQ